MNKYKWILIFLLMAGVALAGLPTRYESGFIVWATDMNLNGNNMTNGTVNMTNSTTGGYAIINLTGIYANGSHFWGEQSTAPSGAGTADLYYNTSRNKICWYNGTGWNSTSDVVTNC